MAQITRTQRHYELLARRIWPSISKGGKHILMAVGRYFMKQALKQLTRLIAVLAITAAVTSCSSHHGSKSSIDLFNGRDLKGWDFILADSAVKMDKVWSVEGGILTCQGTPVGAIYKGPKVTNFRLLVEYRWAPGTKPGNSGIFSRISGRMNALPPAIEVQLMHGSAGDVLGLQGKQVASGQPRFFEIKQHPLAGDIAGVKKVFDQERAPGEWNRVEITAEGSRYTVLMNGKLINEVDGVEIVSGPVGLQSEGGVIQFRRVTLTPL